VEEFPGKDERAMKKERTKIIEMLTKAYWMELETVMNYLANAVDLDGVRAEEIKKSLLADVTEELAHAQGFAGRIKQLGGRIPGSAEFKSSQKSLQPPKDSTDVVAVIRGVIDAEESAIAHYKKMIERAGREHDYVTQDLAVRTLADEESHRTLFNGYLKEYTK
jgi:bacterioferritin